MHFLPTNEQLELQRGVRDLLADRFPIDRLSQGFDATLWRALDDTGVFGLRSELGLGMAEAVLVFEELPHAALQLELFVSRQEVQQRSLGRPRMRSPMMLRWI